MIGNGDIFTLQDSVKMKEVTGVNATMSARGLLENPVSVPEWAMSSVQNLSALYRNLGSLCWPPAYSGRSCRCESFIGRHHPPNVQLTFTSPKTAIHAAMRRNRYTVADPASTALLDDREALPK